MATHDVESRGVCVGEGLRTYTYFSAKRSLGWCMERVALGGVVERGSWRKNEKEEKEGVWMRGGGVKVITR